MVDAAEALEVEAAIPAVVEGAGNAAGGLVAGVVVSVERLVDLRESVEEVVPLLL